ncbi:MAG TPA: hypothetical protein VLC09_13420 [Polyangiaceae bacterium]|nr:hypothetical protein [Polyangiaceae bacterium]
MADPFEMLDGLIAKCRSVGEIGKAAAPEIADAFEVDLRRQVAAGTDPNGNAWKPTRDGEQALQDAAQSVGVAPVGSSVVIRVWGPTARHHRGRGKGGIRRQVIPSGKLPERLAVIAGEKLQSAAHAHFTGGQS